MHRQTVLMLAALGRASLGGFRGDKIYRCTSELTVDSQAPRRRVSAHMLPPWPLSGHIGATRLASKNPRAINRRQKRASLYSPQSGTLSALMGKTLERATAAC